MAFESTQSATEAPGSTTPANETSASVPPSTPTIRTVTCDPKGDAILVVNEFTYIRVSSHVLSLGSPVFRALFNGRFSEGQNLDSTDPPKLSFTEDNVDAMACLCRRLHWLDDHLGPIPLDLIFHLAILADKYDCCRVLSLYTGQLSALLDAPEPTPGTSQKQTLNILIIALFARDAKIFSKASTTLCLNINGLACIKGIFKDLPEMQISAQLMAELVSLYGYLLQLFSVYLASAKFLRIKGDYHTSVGSFQLYYVEKECVYQGCIETSASNALQTFKSHPIGDMARNNRVIDEFKANIDTLWTIGLCLDCFLGPGFEMRYDTHSKGSHSGELKFRDRIDSDFLEKATHRLKNL